MDDTTPTEAKTAEGGESGESNDDDLLEEAQERYKLCEEFWGPKREMWRVAARFRALKQWPSDVIAKRQIEERPCLTVDKCNQYVRQVVNDGRQNRPAVKIRPVDDKGDDKIADALQGIVRHVCDKSNADESFDTSLDHAAGNGYGFFRVLTDYAHKDTFNQEILIKRCRNPLAVMIDPNFRAADGSDAKYGFVEDELPRAEFKKRYPDAKFTDWDTSTGKYADGWLGDNVRFVEYYYTVETDRDMHLLVDGTTTDDETYQASIAKGVQVAAIKETRNIPQSEVKWCRLSGAEILQKNEWKGIYIPLIPVFGNESEVDGKVTYSGLIQAAMDAQILYNYMATAFAERVSMTPKAPYVAEEGQIEGHEDEWKNANNATTAVLVYKGTSIEGHPVAAPQRQSASDIPAGYAQAMQHAEHDIQASMGMYNASVGEKSNEKSGKAIMARQREGDTATFHYQDNLNRAIRYLGRILVDLIPKIYDSKRVIRILGEDGEATAAEIDPQQAQAVTQQGSKVIYNLNIGMYDVSVAAGPSYTTKRQEALEAGMQLAQANPQVWALIGDIIIRNADWPGADEIADRLKIMLPPQIQQAESQQHPMPPEIQMAMQQIQDQTQQVQQAHQELTQIGQQVAQDKAANDAEKAKLDAAKAILQSEEKLLRSMYAELSAKLELQALKAAQVVPPVMPPGKNEPAIDPNSQSPPLPIIDQNQPPSGGFFTPPIQ